jgi:hypothetical protein
MRKKMCTKHHISQAGKPEICRDPTLRNRRGSPDDGHVASVQVVKWGSLIWSDSLPNHSSDVLALLNGHGCHARERVTIKSGTMGRITDHKQVSCLNTWLRSIHQIRPR